MKLKKYNMAIYYFSKAVKYLERSNDKVIGNVAKQINPNESVSNLST